jgi:hypothetical protein
MRKSIHPGRFPFPLKIYRKKSLNLFLDESRKVFITMMIIFISTHAYAQFNNVYEMDPYRQYNNICVPKIYGQVPTAGIGGEYLININATFRQNPLFNSTNYFAYKIEAVSFPFFPDINYHPSVPTNRTLTMPWQSLLYDNEEKSWGPNVFQVYEGSFTQGFSDWTATAALVSLAFAGGFNFKVIDDISEGTFIRPYYPHTVHKITIFAKENGVIKDSVFWYSDNTRGRMDFYPFISLPYGSGLPGNGEIDVHFQPKIQINDPPIDPDNYVIYKNNQMVYGPLLGLSGKFFPGWEPITDCSDSLLEKEIADYQSGTYFKHTYTVDYPFDLTIINPSEMRIFNPSDVKIDLNNNRTSPLVFPSGYTFETIKPFYPLKTELADHDNAFMYRNLEDVVFSNNIFNSESQHKSVYYVKNGSKLVIEPCVTIIDADIMVEDGGELVYNADQVYLINSGILPSQGAIVTDNYDFQHLSNCHFDCYKLANYTPNTKKIAVTQNQTWTSSSLQNDFGVSGGELKVSGDIIVKSTYELTLDQSVTLRFSPNSRVIVEEGAKLTINGATLTSACDEFWRGIEVWGNNNLSQIPINLQTGLRIYQGEVQVINGGTIKNAINALWAIKIVSEGNYDWGKTGGVIILDSANFINNNYDVWLGAYHNIHPTSNKEIHNYSRIENSHFEKNDDMPEGYNGYAFIGLWDVGTISIKGNSFKNLKTNINTVDRCRGIEAYNATLNLRDYCPTSGNIYDPLSPSQATPLDPTSCQGVVRNHFEGLYYGVWASNIPSRRNSIIHIDRAEFKDVYHGIYLHNARQPVVTRCNFSISASDPDVNYEPDITYAYGIYLDACKGYRIEENNLTNHAAYESIYGIVINESGPVNNEIYKNYLDTIGISIQAQGNNRGEISKGLGIYCNEMKENYLDILVLDNGIAQNQLIKINYGNQDLTYAAGNTFTSGFHYDYQHYANTSPIVITYFPDVYNIPQYRYRVNIPPSSLLFPDRVCPSKLANSLLASFEDLSNAKIAFNSAGVLLHIWQDGGNANLGNEVETTLPWDVYQQFNELMGISPYLSDDVLLAAINNSVFSSLMIKLLLAANTHAVHNPGIMQAVYDRVPPLPEAYILEIESGFEEVSQLELLRADVAATNHLVDIMTNNIMRIYQMDMEDGEDVENDYIDFIESINTLQSRYDLAALFLQFDDYESMDTTLNGIANRFVLSESQLEEVQNWQTYFGIEAGLKQTGIYPRSLSQAQIIELEVIASSENSSVASAARALLMSNQHGYDYKEIVKPAHAYMPRKGKPIQNQGKVSAQILKVYPIPCNDYITLEYRTSNKYNTLWIDLTDATGKTVFTQKLKVGDHDELLGITGLKPGVYFIRLIGDNSLVAVERITIIR